MEWLAANKAWLFSGIAVAVPLFIIGWLLTRPSRRIKQKQKSGSGSVNIQAGGDISIGDKADE